MLPVTEAVANIPRLGWGEAVARVARHLDCTLEVAKRIGSFNALRPHLHEGRIPARHGGLHTLSDGKVHSGPGKVRPEWWAHAYEDREGLIRKITPRRDVVELGDAITLPPPPNIARGPPVAR